MIKINSLLFNPIKTLIIYTIIINLPCILAIVLSNSLNKFLLQSLLLSIFGC
jgi:hypothetical protein